jgi:hypothetical protein
MATGLKAVVVDCRCNHASALIAPIPKHDVNARIAHVVDEPPHKPPKTVVNRQHDWGPAGYLEANARKLTTRYERIRLVACVRPTMG